MINIKWLLKNICYNDNEVNDMEKCAWIGTGVMGKSMVSHLLKAGYQVTVYNRTLSKAESLKEIGAKVSSTVEEAVMDADMIFTMVGYPKDVEEVYEKIFANCKEGSICIDMTTSSPDLAKKLYEKGKKKNIHLLDAPVSGGDSGAKAGTLSIMVGGEKEIMERCLPLFSLMGNNICYMGSAGCGQHTKMANQIAVAGAISALSEALIYSKAVGLDESKVLEAISKGAAGSWQMDNTSKRILNHDFNPGFYIKHFIKDMRIAQEMAHDKDLNLEMFNTVCHMYEALSEKGYEDLGTQALVKYYNHDFD